MCSLTRARSITLSPMRWTSHNVRLGDEFAFGEPTVGAAELVCARLVQTTQDVLGPLDRLRVLDLACLEGMYGLEFAAHGAEVVATEGREGNADRVRAAAEKQNPERYELYVEDVRELSPDSHGTFDLVLCLGILYHLGGEDVLRLAKAVADCSTRAAFFRTAVGLSDRASVNGYRGFEYPEPPTGWSSMGNKTSFWPTKPSLLNMLLDVGFTTVMEIKAPPVLGIDAAPDGTFLLALKGEPVEVLAAPPTSVERLQAERWPEKLDVPAHPSQRGWLAQRFRKSFWDKRMKRT